VGHRGVEVAVFETAGRGDAETAAREAVAQTQRPACIVACGGDGTVQEVAQALAVAGPALGDACPALGIAPAGRCNDFANALGIPHDVRRLADTLVTGHPTPVDLGRVNGRCFCTVATVGVDAEVSSYVESMRMPLNGTVAYLYGALRVLARYHPPTLRLKGDFGLIERPLFLASTANTSTYGGSIPIVPEAKPTDGVLNLCVIESISRLRALTLIPSVLRRRHGRRREVHFFPTTRVEIDSERALELWADGERMGTTPAVIDVLPRAIRVLLPRPS
jgi:diacylglycerol kinase (ATP)